MFQIEQAEVSQAKAKIAIVGPAGSGKTYTALITAKELGRRILVIDTENKTSSKYARLLGPYDILPLSTYSIKTYIEALEYSAQQAYDVVIIDSLSHAWAGKGGALEQAEQAKSKYGGNKFAAWGDVTPLQNRLVDLILSYPAHLIATMRMKIEYALITGDNGRQQVSKLGLGIIQRDSFEYEFDIIAQMDVEHNLTITKTRCFEIDGFMAHKPDGAMGKLIASWLSDGQPLPPKELSYEVIETPIVVPSKPETVKALESVIAHKQKAERPLSPADVKHFSISRDKWLSAKAPGEKQATYAFTSLSKACEGDDDTRHIVVEYLFGIQSMKDMSAGQCSFIIDWCGAKAENEYAISEDTMKEIRLIVREAVSTAGQTDMFDIDPNEPAEEIAF